MQCFGPSLSYHFPLRSWFCLFFSGRLRQVLLHKNPMFLNIIRLVVKMYVLTSYGSSNIPLLDTTRLLAQAAQDEPGKCYIILLWAVN